MFIRILGIFGGTGTTLSFLPQVLQIFRSNTTNGLSPYMLLIHLTGVSCWTFYGFFRHDYIVMSTNLISMTFVGTIIVKYIMLTRAPKLSDPNGVQGP
jgi:MtN3 and saliva related transmembrane protein